MATRDDNTLPQDHTCSTMKGLAPHRITPSLDQAIQTEAASSAVKVTRTPAPEPSAFFDLVVIGSGPAALALVCRILESRPAALYTEDEHRHLHWLNRSARRPTTPLVRTRKDGSRSTRHRRADPKSLGDGGQGACDCDGRIRILVIDKIGEGWMALWHRLFAAYEIRHLRSPLFFHPDPSDLDALLAFAQREGKSRQGSSDFVWQSVLAAHDDVCSPQQRSHRPKTRGRTKRRSFEAVSSSETAAPPDLVEIPGVVGREVSKHKCKAQRNDRHYARLLKIYGPAVNERDRKDYFTPSTDLFRDFIQDGVVKRYGLRVHNGIAGETAGFHLSLADGTTFGARAVVSAVGPGGRPNIPSFLEAARPQADAAARPEAPQLPPPPPFSEGWAHSSAFAQPSFTFPPAYLSHRIAAGRPTTLLLIGGGLTSAQLASLALHRGVEKVILLLRGHLKVRPFDIGLEWMGRYSNLAKMHFWQTEDGAERLRMLRQARNGGSVTPPYARLLRELEKRGRVEIRTFEECRETQWDEEGKRWTVTTEWCGEVSKRTKAKQEERTAREEWEAMADEDKRRSKEEWLRIKAEHRDVLDSPSTSSSSSSQDDVAPPSSPTSARFDSDTTTSTTATASSTPASPRQSTFEVDYILSATGPSLDFSALPFMRELTSSRPIAHHGGLPVLTQDLQYASGLPLFVVGAYSALQIGPAAFNLGGMREAADRVVTALQSLLLADAPPASAATTSAKEEEGGERGRGPKQTEQQEDGADASWSKSFTHFGFESLRVEG
ncbi:uncharacterized protein PSFLO_02965 [Pseudozyma flocculosa]|uniref:L-ornithine N(5)-monooxygenase n=1 Tax=Pseudozyma flocculosa TaxID=84751 RepID=A0A5C3F048_9BASI|nr:uncharacterized protein PSFLO_02965 [Pseudozyma flocculosa]